MANNLIDFSIDEPSSLDNKSTTNIKPLQSLSSSSSNHSTKKNSVFNANNDFINLTLNHSLDNNPFDRIQKQIDLLDDPFESVEIAATNSKLNANKEYEVQTGNLLSLQEDEISLTPGTNTIKENNFSSFSGNSPDFQSTPINLNISSTPQKPSLLKNKLKNNLLKLSLSNASSSHLSSRSRRNSRTSDEDSPTTVNKSKDPNLMNKISNLTSSRDDSCDDLMNIKPNWVDSENDDCEFDLKMMNIPMLDKIDSIQYFSPNHVDEQKPFRSRFNSEGSISHLAAIREKMVNKRSLDKNDNSSINEMNDIVNEFKNIILERKIKPSLVLESLKNVLDNEEKRISNENISEDSPPSIIRQGTFDIDLKDGSHLPDADKDIDINQSNVNIKYMETAFDTPSPNQQNLNSVLEQLGKFFGTPNLNVVQTNLTSQNINNSTPTYIVLMNSSHAVEKNHEKNDQAPIRRRSQSLSVPSNRRNSLNKAQPKPKIVAPEIAPKLIRRNSITSTYGPQSKASNVNSKSVIVSTSQNQSNTIQNRRRSTVSNVKTPISIDLQTKKLKLKSSENIASRGPIKATIPIKKLAKSIAKTPAKDFKNSDKLNICTPITRPNFPKASSTPMVTTPEISLLRRNRSGFLSSPKSNLSISNRRRTVTATGSTNDMISKVTGITKPHDWDNKQAKKSDIINNKIGIKSNPNKNKENTY